MLVIEIGVKPVSFGKAKECPCLNLRYTWNSNFLDIDLARPQTLLACEHGFPDFEFPKNYGSLTAHIDMRRRRA